LLLKTETPGQAKSFAKIGRSPLFSEIRLLFYPAWHLRRRAAYIRQWILILIGRLIWWGAADVIGS